MIGWGMRMFMTGFCLAATLIKFVNGDDATFSVIATVCWLLSALLSYYGQNWRFR